MDISACTIFYCQAKFMYLNFGYFCSKLKGAKQMRIAAGVEMLEISANTMGTPSIINPTLIYDNKIVILVDVGFPGQLA
jgi:hypothetical protein